MGKPKDRYTRRLSLMFRAVEFDNLQKLADMEGKHKSEILRELLAREVDRRKRNGRWDNEGN